MRESADRDFRIFCLAISGQTDALRHALAEERPDWRLFIEGAGRHRMEQQLLAGLKAAEIPLPPELADLQIGARIATHRSLLQLRETARLAALFEKQGVPLLVLKGVALSIQLDRDPGMRSSRDVDLLVSPDDAIRASRIMHQAGYRNSGPSVPQGMEDDYTRWSKETEYTHAEHGMLVELHHRLSDNDILLDRGFQDLWRDRDAVEIAGQSVAVMARRHLALYLCVHGATHGWERLSWLADLTGALSSPDDIEHALQSAAEENFSAPMLQAMTLAHDWLGLVIEPALLARARSNDRVRRLDTIMRRSYAAATWYRSPERGTLAGFLRYSVWLRLYVYSLKPGWRYVKRQLALELITPADWDAFRLPKHLSWLYPVIRPFGWLLRRITRAI